MTLILYTSRQANSDMTTRRCPGQVLKWEGNKLGVFSLHFVTQRSSFTELKQSDLYSMSFLPLLLRSP